MSRLRYNNQAGLLGGDPGITGTNLLFGTAPDFATLVAPDNILLILDPGTALFEIVYLTAYVAGATSGTVIRQAEDSGHWPAVAHPSGRWAHGPVASDFVPNPTGIPAGAGSPHSAPYQLALTDAGALVEMDSGSAINVTMPTNASVPFSVGTVIEICQKDAGPVTVIPISGAVTLHQASTATTRAPWSILTLRQRAVDEWVVGGDTT